MSRSTRLATVCRHLMRDSITHEDGAVGEEVVIDHKR